MLKCRTVFDQEAEFVKLNAELDVEAKGLLQEFQHILVSFFNVLPTALISVVDSGMS